MTCRRRSTERQRNSDPFELEVTGQHIGLLVKYNVRQVVLLGNVYTSYTYIFFTFNVAVHSREYCASELMPI